MPFIQKAIQLEESRAMTISKSWLAYYERKSRRNIKEVSVEIDGKLIIRWILSEDDETPR